MVDLEQSQQERDIVDLIRQTPGDWQEIRVHVCASVVTFGITTSANIRLPRGPRRLSPPIVQLRESMVDPQRGAWLMADVVVPRVGEATLRYDWMTKPDWPSLGGDVDDALYLKDLEQYPRSPENIPDWYPTPDTAAPLPKGTDADAESDRTPPPPPRHGDDANVTLTGLDTPFGVATDADGTLYVTDTGHDRVVAVPASSEQPRVLPFSGLGEPCGVAVDAAGTVYVADSINNRVLALAAGDTSATELPLNGLHYPGGIAVDTAGAVYVTDRTHRQVLKLPAGATEAAVLPFTGLRWLIDVAVDDAGTVYVADRASSSDDTVGGRILALAPGTDQPTELASGLRFLGGVTVDAGGDIYVAEKVTDGRVLKLSAGSFSILASRLHSPSGVAVDPAGDVYVTEEAPPDGDERSGGRVLKLPVPH